MQCMARTGVQGSVNELGYGYGFKGQGGHGSVPAGISPAVHTPRGSRGRGPTKNR